MIVASVLKKGGVYDLDYVYRLQRGVRRNLKIDHHFVCLTDEVIADKDFSSHGTLVPLNYNWKGWWSKMELYGHPALNSERVLFFDLDTVITGDISGLAEWGGDFGCLDDFYNPGRSETGVLSFRPSEARWIFETFLANPDGHMASHHGDGSFIRSLDINGPYLQHEVPGHIASYKPNRGAYHRTELEGWEKVVCFHGKPKPRDVVDEVPWVKNHWF